MPNPTLRGTNWGGASTNTSELLVAYITDEIKVLEPELHYTGLGYQKDVPAGRDRITFPQTNQLPVKINVSMVTTGGPTVSGSGSVWGAGASIQGGAAATAPGFPVSSTEGVAAITEGTNPTAITWGATAYATGPAQYGILVQISDLLIRDSVIDAVSSCTEKVNFALTRMVDTVLQNVVNGGTNGVIYAGGKTSRSGLGAGDLATMTEMVKAVRNLRSANAAGLKPFEGGYYAAVIHPFVMSDLMLSTGSGSWVDIGRYTSTAQLIEGKMMDFRGIRYLESAYQNYFNSTTNVFPTTVVGERSFGWGYFQPPTAILVSTPDSNNPLNLFNSIGGKVTLGATRFEDSVGTQRIIRVESASAS